MKLEERIMLIKAGYSAQDIANFEKAEDFTAKPEQPKPEVKPEQPKPEEKPEQPEQPKPEGKPDSEPAWAKALADSIKTLTAAAQAANRRFDDMGEPQAAVDKALSALNEIYGGAKK